MDVTPRGLIVIPATLRVLGDMMEERRPARHPRR